jgi:phytanoyl-CoA hydroxylase
MTWYLTSEREMWGAKIMEAPDDLRPWLSAFLQQGYIVIPKAISDDALQEARQAYFNFKKRIAHFDPPSANGRYRRIVNLHAAIPEMATLFTKSTFTLRIIDYLFGEEASLYTSLFYEIGSSQGLHRDTPYFWTNPGYRYFGYWVALEDVDRSNGCLQVVPGSHLLKEEDLVAIATRHYSSLDQVPASDPRLWDEYQGLANTSASLAGLSLVDCEIGAGDAIIWHPHTLHGGRVITDNDRTRLSLVMHVTPVNQAVYHHQGFFNPGAQLASRQNKEYFSINGRKCASYDSISFEHILDLPIDHI